MSFFPFFQSIEGKTFLIAGEGEIARRKQKLLGQFTDRIRLFPEKAPGSPSFSEKDLEGVDFCVASTDDSDENRRIAMLCQAAGVPVNVPDDPSLCSFYLPSVIKKGDLVVAVSTGGKSPAMAARLRRQIEEELDKSLPADAEEILEQMGKLRQWLPSLAVDGKTRRKIYGTILQELLDGSLKTEEAQIRKRAAELQSRPAAEDAPGSENLERLAELQSRPAAEDASGSENLERLAELKSRPAVEDAPGSENLERLAELQSRPAAEDASGSENLQEDRPYAANTDKLREGRAYAENADQQRISPPGERKQYSFFQNRDCEYFPCHQTEDPENFNCLFCYCPLYALGKKCGGHYRYTEKGIKDCTGCDFPHRRENYKSITGRFAEIMAVVKQTDADGPVCGDHGCRETD